MGVESKQEEEDGAGILIICGKWESQVAWPGDRHCSLSKFRDRDMNYDVFTLCSMNEAGVLAILLYYYLTKNKPG